MAQIASGASTDSIVSAQRNLILNELKSMNPMDAAAAYAKRMAEFQEKLSQKIKTENNSLLTNLLANINPECSSYWNTKYTAADIDRLQYYMGCCNGNFDRSIAGKISSVVAQKPVVDAKMKEFQINPDNKDGYKIQMGEDKIKYA